MDSTVRGNQPAGPARWKRAEQWAAENPYTTQGMKYRARVAQAEKTAAMAPDLAWEHYSRDWDGRLRYRGQTCRTYCAMLQLQLNSSDAYRDALLPVILVTPLEELQDFVVARKPDSKRKGKCLVCGSDVV